jgi:hypothetical protein
MEENKQKILDRIAKLLTLAADQYGKPEGDTAKKLASSLMAKYRIAESEVDLSTKSSSDIVEDGEGWIGLCDQGGKRQWVADLGRYLAKTFDCRMYININQGTVHFIGTIGDVETCLYFMDIVFGHIERKARLEIPSANGWKKRNIFGQAAMSIIRVRLEEMERGMRQEMTEHYSGGTSLMVVKNQLVNKTYDEIAKEMGFTNSKRRDVKMGNPTDHRIIIAGMEAGKSAPLNIAIGN